MQLLGTGSLVYWLSCRYLHQIGTGKATQKQNQGFVEKFDQVEAAFDLFGFSKKVHMPFFY